MIYTPKEMKRIWALVVRYCERPSPYGQEQFDKIHSYVDRGPPTKFTNKVRRAVGLPVRALVTKEADGRVHVRGEIPYYPPTACWPK